MQLMLGLLMMMLSDLPVADCHARLWEPPGRSSMWRRGFATPVNYQDNELFCGGFMHQVSQNYKCGVCGDPYDGRRDNEAGGKYALGIVTRTYRQGQDVTFQVDVTANHKGYFEFKICPTNDPKRRETQECFDQYPLRVLGTPGYRYYVPASSSIMSVKLALPPNLTCNFCVVQLRYHAGNNWGTDPDGKSCVGCGYQEEFYGCSDIRIVPRGSSQTIPEEGIRSTRSDQTTTTTGIKKLTVTTDRPQYVTTDRSRSKDFLPGGGKQHVNLDTTSTDASTDCDKSSGPSTAGQAATVSPNRGDNIICRGVNKQTMLDRWCQLNCQLGNCPKTHCICVEGQYPHSSDRKTGCRAAGAFAEVAGYDTWCRENCKLGMCPTSICVC